MSNILFVSFLGCNAFLTTRTTPRYYGQAGLQEEPDDAQTDRASIAPSAAMSFADRPLGMNDTRERMQSIFGKDQVWAQGMLKRQQQDAAERDAASVRKAGTPEQSARDLEKASEEVPSRPQTPAEPPVLDVDVPIGAHRQEPTAEWFAGASDHDSDSNASSIVRARKSHDDYQRRTSLTLQHALNGDSGRRQADAGDASAESDSSEDVPLSQLKNRQSTLSMFGHLRLQHLDGENQAESEEDEEVPLSQLLAKKKTFLGGEFAHLEKPKLPDAVQVNGVNDANEDEDEDDDAPLGLVHPNGFDAVKQLKLPVADDSDDEPLGAVHPQAAIIAQQAALIKQLQAERFQGMPAPWSVPPQMVSRPPLSNLPPVYNQVAPTMDMPPAEIGMMGSPFFDPKSTLIDRWRNDVKPASTNS